MRVIFAAVPGSVIDGCGPRAGVPGAGGEVAGGVAELAAGRPPELDRGMLAGLAGDRCNPGQPGQRLRVGEPGPAVPDLGQQPRRAQRARARQGGEDVPVGVGGQLPGDLGSRALTWAVSAHSVAVRAAVTPA